MTLAKAERQARGTTTRCEFLCPNLKRQFHVTLLGSRGKRRLEVSQRAHNAADDADDSSDKLNAALPVFPSGFLFGA
jgi:hypothetical protein